MYMQSKGKKSACLGYNICTSWFGFENRRQWLQDILVVTADGDTADSGDALAHLAAVTIPRTACMLKLHSFNHPDMAYSCSDKKQYTSLLIVSDTQLTISSFKQC